MSMTWYIGRRLAWALLASFIIMSVTFGFLTASPNPATSTVAWEAAQEGDNPEDAIETYEQTRGENRPLSEQYIDFMVSMYTLDWGDSYTYDTDVMEVIGNSWVYSALIVVPSTIIAVVVGFAVGIYSSTHQYTKSDYAATFFAFFGISVPNFWLSIMLILIFGVMLQWLPASYSPDRSMAFWSLEHVKYLIMPIFVLTTAAVASEMRYARAETLEYVNAEWVKSARAKGVSEWRIMYHHIFRPATPVLITILVADFVGIIFSTAYIVEVIFGIPGLGLVSYNALIRMDTPLVLATTLVPVILAILANLLQDILYTVLDPRISYEARN
ncbi:ABC transporter permease [Natronosalvus halobius]|uniref:ABC transporter permease n=1 Tax=Natronosalvus halobius TaxID=2953746 RepID=UPI00209CA2AA|nr:ABC transporter permease [Natronosalvus halobius]USZ70302.1 ABC transporter permease [Natronosalvus halobius]